MRSEDEEGRGGGRERRKKGESHTADHAPFYDSFLYSSGGKRVNTRKKGD